MAKIVVIVKGGIVQRVLSEQELEVLIVDQDVEGEETVSLLLGEEAHVSLIDAEVDKDTVATVFDQAIQQAANEAINN